MEEILKYFYELTWSEITIHIIVTIFGALFLLVFKPLKKPVTKLIKRLKGKERHSVIVRCKVVARYNSNGGGKNLYEVELPYKDISGDSMTLEESTQLIMQAINNKYGCSFNRHDYALNHLSYKKKTFYL
ncbi:hypothetical protein K8O68_09470 [Salipaludibacillus sp. CUR1]|uniref:hypothetical protein n=1 Tax=Salipaludibacillus sp. CUR1 TaxID=2820003 RepID=UPI001E391F5C|nr:hypothetical protein [Salipaludibacillus sp. CUR1]MCE7792643.1 hypothetical protein [Salipaludibacillus sp. CUR1]